MKPKTIFYLAFALVGILWIVVITSTPFANWVNDRSQNLKWPDVVIYMPNTNGTYTTKLKAPWTNSTVVLYRASGEVVQLDAKSAVYMTRSTMPSTNVHKPFDIPVTVFIDPATRKVWAGWVAAGEGETNEYENDDHTTSTNYLIYTNLYFETASGIFRGDNVIWDGTFTWDESLIDKAQPGEGLDSVIGRIETNTGSGEPFPHIYGRSWFGDYFPEEFFSSGNVGSQSVPIKRIKVANGKLRLDIDSLKYKTMASVWLDLKTFKVRQAIEFRPVHFNLETFCWSVVPAFIAIIMAIKTVLLARKVRSVTHSVLSVIVLACVIWSLVTLYRIYILGAWPAHLPFFHPGIALGDWAKYLPVAGIGIATMITAAQALLARSAKNKSSLNSYSALRSF
jgi:hypothetical protein